MSFITVSGVLTNSLGVILPNTLLKFSAIRTSHEVLNSISVEIETNEYGAYSFDLMFGVYSLSIKNKNEIAYKPVASNIVVINTNQSGSLTDLIYNQQILQEVDEELIAEMLGIQHATEAAAAAAAISEANADISEANALASKNAAAISETNAASSAASASTDAASALASKNAAAISANEALTSKNAASVSEANAANSATSALASKNAASTSEANAASSAASALASKNAANTSEVNAASSAAGALASQNAATVSETNAANSAASALASKNAANTSEVNAANSAASAAISEANAASSAASALSSKNAAAISEANADISEANALASKNAAAISEANADISEANALTSKNAAAISEANAANSAASALASKNAAAISETNADISEANALNYANSATTSAASALDSKNAAATSASSALASQAAAEAAKVAAENAAASITGAMVEAGSVNMSSGIYPEPLKDSVGNNLATFWKVTAAGTAISDGVSYGVGDSVVYSNTLSSYYKIDNTEAVSSVNGKQGIVSLVATDVGALPISGGALTGPVGLKTIQGQGSSIGWASIDVTGIKGGYAGINFTDTGHWFGIRPDGLSGVWDSAGNSKWYFNELGQLTGGAKVPWGIVYDTPGRTDWANKNSIGVVSGQLAWKNYGNGHTIFDASAGTSPDGTVVDKNNSQIAWSSNGTNYPTLMGWNGVNTYGVRVDSARWADGASSALTADRLTGIVSTNGQDLTIHGKRAMVGSGESNTLILNYGSDWGSVIIYGNVFTGPMQSDRLLAIKNGSTNYTNAGLETRSTDGSDARVSFHRVGYSAGAINHNSWGFQFEREAGGGSRANVAAANFFADAPQDTNGNALTRLDYVNALVNSRNVHTWKGQKGNANASFGLGSYIWHPTVTNAPIANTYAHGFQFGGTDYVDGQWVSDIAFIHGHGLYHRASVNGGFTNWSKFAFTQDVNYSTTPTQYRSTSSWIGLVSGVINADVVVLGTNSGAATIGAHTNGLDTWAPLYINCHPNSSTTAPLVLSAPKVKLPDNNTLYDVFHAGNFDPNSKLSNNGSGGTLYLSNWFRSTGATGWYNETYGGGIYQDEASTVKVYGGKKFYSANTEYNAIAATGGIFSYRGMSVDTRTLVGNGGSYNYFRYNDAPFHAGFGGLNVGSFAPIVGSAHYTNGYGYTTRIQLGALTPGATGWSSAVLMVGSAESDAHPLATYTFDAYGNMTGLSSITLSGNANIGNDMSCNYAYANGVQPQVPNALTRYDYVNAQCSSYRWDNRQVIGHGGGDANAHYNSAWDGNAIANAPTADWYFFRELYHSGGNNWRHQEAFNFFVDEEWFRRGQNSAGDYGPWRRRWHSGNFDPASKSDVGHTHQNVIWTGSASSIPINLADGIYVITAYVGDGGGFTGTFILEVESRSGNVVMKSSDYTIYSNMRIQYTKRTTLESSNGAVIYSVTKL